MARRSALFQFKQGDHACVFYRSENSLMEILSPYVAEGLRKGERCFGAQKASTLKRLFYDLRFLGIDVEREIRRGALEFHTEDEVYFPRGKFEPHLMIDMLLNSIDEAARSGFSGFRTAGELSWAAQGRRRCDQVISYEKLVERAFPGRAATGLCQYPIDKFPPEVLTGVLDAHRMHIEDMQSGAACAALHVRYPTCSAEIVADKSENAPNYYYVVEQQQPKNLLAWGIAADFDAAAACAEKIAAEMD